MKHFRLAPLSKATIAFSTFLLVLNTLCFFQKAHSSKSEVCSYVHFKWVALIRKYYLGIFTWGSIPYLRKPMLNLWAGILFPLYFQILKNVKRVYICSVLFNIIINKHGLHCSHQWTLILHLIFSKWAYKEN